MYLLYAGAVVELAEVILYAFWGEGIVWCTKPWACFSQRFGREKPSTLTDLNLPMKEMSEIDTKLTLNDANPSLSQR